MQHYIFPAEARFVDADFVRIGTQLACWEMIRGGTTTFVDTYFYPDAIARVTEQCGLRAIIAAPVIDYPSPGFKGWDDSFAAAKTFVEQWKNHRLITPAIGPHAPYTVNPEHLEAASKAARELGVPLSIHVSETAHEVEQIKQRYGKRPVEHLNAHAVLNSSLITAHMVWPDAGEIKLLADHGVGVIHNPGSNMKLASGFAPVPEMLKAGVKVGLGSDGAASNNDLDMWEEIRLAALIHKGRLLDPTVMPAAEVLGMATLGGAEAIGLSDKVGAITAGRRADLIQVSIDQAAHALPLYSVISHLVYSVKSADVVNVVVDGRILMRDQTVLTLDQRVIAAGVNQISRRIKVD
ncbi:MAG: amidohydrolase [Mariprofundus sp.]